MSDSGYSGTPLPRKLGLKPGLSALFVALPDGLRHLTNELPGARIKPSIPEGVSVRLDYLHVFETERTALEDNAERLKGMLKPTGMLWISWPKKASKVETTITEDVLRAIFLPIGLVDIKVCAVTDIWSGLKFVFRKDQRGSLG
ncbi:hypothetical protein J5J10_03295 [Ciceribacter sp. L1K23]|uniref:hypothetical protein n=1 Tax=Ciceribacter sp. L1K23 TaxID=2820276 RepID=UPI001B832895|nr:hypothetical protein [Ciceribacter sp. L1K23]MBR0554695.1 hypothetical protein [Ciceribacter sp. L1K23]